jgi:hypothetical protein
MDAALSQIHAMKRIPVRGLAQCRMPSLTAHPLGVSPSLFAAVGCSGLWMELVARFLRVSPPPVGAECPQAGQRAGLFGC